jgi:phospholipid-binding lipoprotein MlaA
MSPRRLALCCLLIGIALPPVARAADPFEAVNRRTHAFNRVVQQRVLGPAAEFFLAHTSSGFRHGAAGVLANLGEPVTALSSLAAGDTARALNAAARFGINSTLGLAGIRDRAATMGYPQRRFTVADALCRWGVPGGPFLVLPLLGPSTLRDAGAMAATGTALSQVIGPDSLLVWNGTEAFLDYTRLHQELAQIEATALDAYAVQRSAYLQRRAALCPVDGGEAGEP